MFFRFFLAHRHGIRCRSLDSKVYKSIRKQVSVYYVGTQVFVYSTRCLSPESYQAVEVSLTQQRENACLHQLLCRMVHGPSSLRGRCCIYAFTAAGGPLLRFLFLRGNSSK